MRSSDHNGVVERAQRYAAGRPATGPFRIVNVRVRSRSDSGTSSRHPSPFIRNVTHPRNRVTMTLRLVTDRPPGVVVPKPTHRRCGGGTGLACDLHVRRGRTYSSTHT